MINGESVCVIERGPKLRIDGSGDDTTSLILYDSHGTSYLVKCKTPIEMAELFVLLMSMPIEKKEKKTVVIEQLDIPEIDIGFTDGVEQVKEVSIGILNKVLPNRKEKPKAEGKPPSADHPPPKRQRKVTTTTSTFLPEELNIARIDEAMTKRLLDLREKSPPSKAQSDEKTMNQIMESYKIVAETELDLPDIEISPADEQPKFTIPQTSLTECLFQNSVTIPNYEVPSICTEIPIDSTDSSFTDEDKPFSPIDLVIDSINECPSNQMSNTAASIFVNGRKVSLAVLYDKFQEVQFTDIGIQSVNAEKSFDDAASLISYFDGLFDKDLVSVFFKEISRAEKFVTACYSRDAIIKNQAACKRLCKAFHRDHEQSTKVDLPLRWFHAPHVRIGYASVFVANDHLKSWIKGSQLVSFDPFIEILLGLVGFEELMFTSDGSIGGLWKAVKDSPATGEFLEELGDLRVSNEIMNIAFFIQGLVDHTLDKWITSVSELSTDPRKKAIGMATARAIEQIPPIFDGRISYLDELATNIAQIVQKHLARSSA